MARIQLALVSVWDKTGVADFAAGLAEFGVEILSTGGTAKLLRERGLKVTEVSDYTGFPEMLDGRVKTLHPKIHGGLLGMRDKAEHRDQMAKHGIRAIDMVVVNLYPFEATIAKPNVTLEDAIENIDIGGPTMIRSASKNYKHVAVVTNPARYQSVVAEMRASGGGLSEKTRFELAAEAFRLTAGYDTAITNYLHGLEAKGFPSLITLSLTKRQELRYGENPHQKGAFYVERRVTEPSIGTAEQLSGKELSYNNLLDLNAALELVKEFDAPTAVVIKHNNPCGVGSKATLGEAFRKAYSGDPQSAFGGIVAVNRPVDAAAAEEIIRPRVVGEDAPAPAGYFLEGIVAPGYSDEALKILTSRGKWGKEVRLMRVRPWRHEDVDRAAFDMQRVVGGMLVQTRDMAGFDPSKLKTVTKRAPTERELADLRFAWLVCKHVKSNAIVFVKDSMVTGVGAGQMSRLDSVFIAAKKAGSRAKGSVLGSDAFFPFRDGIDEAAKAGITAIAQPGGSARDADAIAAANEHGMAMVFTGERHFRH